MEKDHPPNTIGQVFNDISHRHANSEAIIYGDLRIDYITFRGHVDALARSLIKIGIRKGDKVAVLISNRPEIFYTQYALAKIGAVCVFINTRYRVNEIFFILKEAEIRAFILIDRFLKTSFWDILHDILPEIEKAKPGHIKSDRYPDLTSVVIYSVEGQRYPGAYDLVDLTNPSANTEFDEQLKIVEASVKPSDIAIISFTSGTTGQPKGAMLTHSNILWHNAYAYPQKAGYFSNDRHMVPNPIATAGGSTSISVTNIATGSATILVDKFDPRLVLSLIDKENCTILHGVPAMYQMYLDELSSGSYSLASLKTAFVAGDYCSPSLARRIRNEITENLIIGYGQTEASVMISITSPEDPYEKQLTTVGRPFEGLEVMISNPETHKKCPFGEVGEICVKGPIVMKGYFKKPQETKKAIDRDHWLHTGDLGSLDEEGFLTIKGRLREMFISGGFNIYPLEIENFLQSHSKIKVAKIVPIPDQKMGQVVGALIEVEGKAICDDKEIVDFCRKRIANYKIPHYLKFVNEWPMIAIGKVDKLSLQNDWIQELKLKSLL